ncbi:tRNA threonylcarbamoyladenosine dehydratase [Thiolapillus brandeum]|uniref:UBA/ThiF-type NAD/FAD binding protein n=1 Tax=Thiolapillus brandeum TaxID=1076588 RepID=A0A7U6GJC1_9GAMM|nr:UBA/ThiF-type NAD/FAD binding protein [Thiolapillus brandeum]
MDFQRRFGGVARLYGQASLERFCRSRVCVIGIGGVGSWVVEALARSAIGELVLIDMDHVAESNINRQLPAQSSTLGASKIQVMAERVAEINPSCRCRLVDDFVTTENVSSLITAEYDFVIDCIDSFRVKTALISRCRRQRIPLVTLGGAGGQIDPCRIRVSDLSRTEQDPLLARVRRELRRSHGFPRNPKRSFGVPAVWSDEPLVRHEEVAQACDTAPAGGLNCGGFGSCTPVTAGFGMAAAALVLRKLSC